MGYLDCMTGCLKRIAWPRVASGIIRRFHNLKCKQLRPFVLSLGARTTLIGRDAEQSEEVVGMHLQHDMHPG